ncbi:MAG: hypothetical protein ACP5N1_02565 [Candidatus Woesearchaeota archaeon]
MNITDKIGIVNPEFTNWSNLIDNRLKSQFDNTSYTFSEGKLLMECIEHASKYSTHNVKNQVLGVVHPFFMQLLEEHKKVLTDCTKKDEKIYLENVINLLTNKSRNYSIILFETAQGYAASSSYFAKMRIFDEVIFTQPETGYFVTDQLITLEKYVKSEFNMIGSYADACILQAKESIDLLTNKKASLIENCCISSVPSEDRDNLLLLPDSYNKISKTEFFIKTGEFGLPP